jgi:hypothetical protein
VRNDGKVATAARAIAVGDAAIIGTFAAHGPTQCSCLPTNRYDPTTLADLFKPDFVLEHSESERHATPMAILRLLPG